MRADAMPHTASLRWSRRGAEWRERAGRGRGVAHEGARLQSDARLHALAEQHRLDGVAVGGSGEEKALPHRAAEGLEPADLPRELDPFGDGLQAERVPERDDRPGERRLGAAGADVVDEGLRDLEDVDREAL